MSWAQVRDENHEHKMVVFLTISGLCIRESRHSEKIRAKNATSIVARTVCDVRYRQFQ